MALKNPKILTSGPSQAAKKSDIAIVDIGGRSVTDYCSAVVAKKTAEAAISETAVDLKAHLTTLWDLCIKNSDNPPSSIKLRDELGTVVRLTSQDKYSQIDPEAADAVFENIGADLNEFAQFSVAAKFDSGVFLAKAGTTAGDAGNFSAKIYSAYKKALDKVTAELTRDGLLPPETPSPLVTVKVATVKPGFHERRWKAFPSVEHQKMITEVMPNTVVLVPVIDAAAAAT